MNTFLLYVIVILLLASGIFAFLWQRCKASHERALKRGISEARKVEGNATDKLVEGLANENKVTGSIDDGDFLN